MNFEQREAADKIRGAEDVGRLDKPAPDESSAYLIGWCVGEFMRRTIEKETAAYESWLAYQKDTVSKARQTA